MNVTNVVMLFVWIVVVVGLAGLAYWVVNQFSAPPQVVRIANIIIVVVAVLFLIFLLLNTFGLLGSAPQLTP